jgi:hypothetical protein
MKILEDKRAICKHQKTNFVETSLLLIGPLSFTLVLQRIREVLFTDVCKSRSSPIVCSDQAHFL